MKFCLVEKKGNGNYATTFLFVSNSYFSISFFLNRQVCGFDHEVYAEAK